MSSDRPLSLQTAWEYLQDLRAGPRPIVTDIAWAVGFDERTDVFELAYLTWCACAMRESAEEIASKVPEEHRFNPIALFVSGLKGQYMGKKPPQLWTERPTHPDEQVATEFLRSIRTKNPEETAVVLAASSFSIDKSIMRGLPE